MAKITIYNEDCLNVLKSIKDNSIDLIITDPPYEHEYHGGGKRKRAQDYTKLKENTEFMNEGFNYLEILPELVRVCKVPNIIIFCSNKQIAKLMTWFEDNNLNPTLTTWKKKNACPLGGGKYISDIEFAIFARGKKAPWNHSAPSSIKYKCKVYPFVAGKNKKHPAQKPLGLIKEYVELHSLEGQTILDPYMGSGTTGIACKQLNRNFIGIEINKEHFLTSKERLTNEI